MGSLVIEAVRSNGIASTQALLRRGRGSQPAGTIGYGNDRRRVAVEKRGGAEPSGRWGKGLAPVSR